MRKIDIDWERVYSGFVASGLNLREFHRLHLQCFFPGVSLPALSLRNLEHSHDDSQTFGHPKSHTLGQPAKDQS